MTPPNEAARVLLGLSEKEAASVTASKRKVATPAAGPAIGSSAGPSGVKRGWESDSETETDSGDSATGVACGVCGVHQVQSSPPKEGSPAQKKAKRECAICGTDYTCQWYTDGKDSDGVTRSTCERCYRWAHTEAVNRVHAGLKCSSCGKGTNSRWYGLGTDHVKCASCYQKALRESVKKANIGLKCSSCGRDKSCQWYGVGTDSVKCHTCHMKAHREAVNRAHAGLKCSSCGRDSSCQWYGIGTESVKCATCYEKARIAAIKQQRKNDLQCSLCGSTNSCQWYGTRCQACYQKARYAAKKHMQSHPGLQCSTCGRDTTSLWYGIGTDSVKCNSCYRKVHSEAVKQSHPGLQCSSCGKDTTCKWYGVGTDSVKCAACNQKAFCEAVKRAHPGLRCSSCGEDTTCKWFGVGTDRVKCNACYRKAHSEAVKQSHRGLQCSSCAKDTTSQWYGVGTDSVKCAACYNKARKADKKRREKMQNVTEEPEPAVDPFCEAGNDGNKASSSDDTEQGTLPVAAEQRPARAEKEGGAKTNKRFSQRFLLDAEIPNKLYLRFAPGMGGLPTLKNPYVKLLRMTPVRKVVSTLFKKLPKDSHRLNEPEDLELLSNTDVLPLGMTMSALLQGEGGAHKPPRCEWRRSVENGAEVEKVIIDVSYRARRVEPKESHRS